MRWGCRLRDVQSYCSCSKWSPLAATAMWAVKHLVKFATALLTCSCGSSSQMVCRVTFNSSYVLRLWQEFMVLFRHGTPVQRVLTFTVSIGTCFDDGFHPSCPRLCLCNVCILFLSATEMRSMKSDWGTLGNSLNVGFRAGWVCIRQEARLIDINWRRTLQMDLLTYWGINFRFFLSLTLW